MYKLGKGKEKDKKKSFKSILSKRALFCIFSFFLFFKLIAFFNMPKCITHWLRYCHP